MKTLDIHFNHNNEIRFIEDVYNIMVTGSHLIVTTKKTEENQTGEHFLFTSNEVFNLSEIANYTIKQKTIRYGFDE